MAATRKEVEEAIDLLIPVPQAKLDELDPLDEETFSAIRTQLGRHDSPVPQPELEKLDPVNEHVFSAIQEQLGRHEDFKTWHQSPRLYTLLRMLQIPQEDDNFRRFEDAKMNDFWLPIKKGTFLALQTTIDWEAFSRVQSCILSRPECMTEAELLGTPNVHRHLNDSRDFFDDADFYRESGETVSSVQKLRGSSKGLVCKRVIRATNNISKQGSQAQKFVDRIKAMRKADHPHTVRLAASYTESWYFGLQYQAAEESLQTMLTNITKPLSTEQAATLRQSFGCLMSALTYMHNENICLVDLQPSNILFTAGRPLLSDFAICEGSTEDRPRGSATYVPEYSSPEVHRWGIRGKSADVWSMGRVFCDIVFVLAGGVHGELSQQVTGGESIHGRGSLKSMQDWLAELKLEGQQSEDRFPQAMVRRMIRMDPSRRQTAEELLVEIIESSACRPEPSVGTCCQGFKSSRPKKINRSSAQTEPSSVALEILKWIVRTPAALAIIGLALLTLIFGYRKILAIAGWCLTLGCVFMGFMVLKGI